jgi:hypothetical protein
MKRIVRELLDAFPTYELVKINEKGDEGGYVVLKAQLFSYLDLREAEKIAHRYSFQLFFSVSPCDEKYININLMLKRVRE